MAEIIMPSPQLSEAEHVRFATFPLSDIDTKLYCWKSLMMVVTTHSPHVMSDWWSGNYLGRIVYMVAKFDHDQFHIFVTDVSKAWTFLSNTLTVLFTKIWNLVSF